MLGVGVRKPSRRSLASTLGERRSYMRWCALRDGWRRLIDPPGHDLEGLLSDGRPTAGIEQGMVCVTPDHRRRPTPSMRHRPRASPPQVAVLGDHDHVGPVQDASPDAFADIGLEVKAV